MLSRLRPPAHRLRIPATRRRYATERYNPTAIERESDDVDVCIVGAGPSGLSAAIRIKQLNADLRVVVLEKGSEVGAHILSGCCLEPRALRELLGTDYSEKYGPPPAMQPATHDRMLYLASGTSSIPLPHPPQMSNKGNFIISLSEMTRWLSSVAEEHYGVEVYPGFSGASLVYSEAEESNDPWDGWTGRWGNEVTKIFKETSEKPSRKVSRVIGVATNDVGVNKEGMKKDSFEPGMIFRSKITLLAEGAHGSLSKTVLNKYDLRRESEPQTYGFGLKEVWRVDDSVYKPGEVIHSLGYPLDNNTYGGGFAYHMHGNLVSLGLVLGADWKNPYQNPYKDFQKMKSHPVYKSLLTSPNAERIAYGARTLNEGGLQSVPLLHFPGGAMIGCSAGFVNITKIKGVHNAMKTGILGAEAAVESISKSDEGDMSAYSTAFKSSWVYDDLNEVRNVRPAFSKGALVGGVAYAGVDSLVLKGRGWWTFRHTKSEEERLKHITSSPSFDASHTESASLHTPPEYPAFDPAISTDLLTSVSLTGTNHAEDQLSHLRVRKAGQGLLEESEEDRKEHVRVNEDKYAGLLGRACPAGVYEYVDHQLVINSQNCIHCKLCDIKVPTQDITWTVPEGGGGPKYTVT